jgi:hypothetical protein
MLTALSKVFGLGSALVGLLVAALPTPALSADCATLQQWISEHAHELPSTYSELVRYPEDYRRAIFDTLSPEAQSTLWREHFAHYLAAHPHLTKEQVAFIERAEALSTPALFARSSEDPGITVALEQLRREGALLFPKEDLLRLLATLGPPDSLGPPDRLGPTAAPACECSRASDWCSVGSCSTEWSCTSRPKGCGTLYQYPCTGLCILN